MGPRKSECEWLRLSPVQCVCVEYNRIIAGSCQEQRILESFEMVSLGPQSYALLATVISSVIMGRVVSIGYQLPDGWMNE